MPELTETLLNRLGIADAMAHRAKAAAGRLQQAAAKHHDAQNVDIDALGKQIEAAGVGADEDAENRYCRALVARGHMAQAHNLAGLDAGRMPEVGSALEKGRVSQAKAAAAGQGAMDFEENQHPRAAEGTAGQYKPGEFVPKGEQQGAAEKPAHEKEAWELSRSDMKPSSDYDKSYMSNYVDAVGNKTASSRTTPAQDEETPLGTWRRDDYKGSHGTEVEQLRELDPNDLTPSEDTDAPKKADVERYTEWAKEGKKAPPIHVVETDSGKLKISNGHRRWLAAKAAGTKIRAWVSPAATIPDQVDSDGKPMKTGLTHELAIHHATEAGHRVPDEVLQDYPELKEQHDRKRKEALRDAAQSAQEDGHPGLAEAHQDLTPKEEGSPKQTFPRFKTDRDMDSWGEENFGTPAELKDRLGAEAESAVRDYTAMAYMGVNKIMRSQDPGISPAEIRELVEKVARPLSEAIESHKTKTPVTCFRGAFYDPAWGDFGDLAGKTLTDRGFVSTDLDEDIAQGHASDQEGFVIMEIQVPAGTHALYVHGLTRFKTERELILAPHTKLRVVRADEKNRRLVVEVIS